MDDAEHAITRRLELHDAQAGALLEALKDRVDVVSIDSSRPADVVTGQILDRPSCTFRH